MRRYLIFLPSLALGMIGAIWLFFRPFPYEPQTSWLGLLLTAVVLIALLLVGAWLLENTVASFKYAGSLLEQALVRFKITLTFAFP
ncbi:MAG: hypothetical protein ACRCYY_03920 [Trueperaceae bacterium]